MSKRVQVWIVLLAATGLLASAGSTYVHARLLQDPTYASFCDVSATVNCTQVYQSRFGSVAGVPVAFGGVLWFGGVLLLAGAGRRGSAQSQADVAGYLVAWSTAGLAVAMYMAYASLVVLQAFCLLCGFVYVTAIGIFVLAETASATPFRLLPRALARDAGRVVRRPAMLAPALLLAAAASAPAIWLAGLDSETLDLERTLLEAADRNAEFDQWWAGQARVDLPFAVPDGRIVVVKFTDYQCPACARTHVGYAPVFAKYAASHPGDVRAVTMDFPLDPACNDETPAGPHDAACEAAVAVRLARRVGAADAQNMESWLYANQDTMTPDSVAAAAREIAGVEDFAAGYAAVIDEVRADIAAAAALPVEATPTFVINGVLLKSGLAPAFFDRALALELAR